MIEETFKTLHVQPRVLLLLPMSDCRLAEIVVKLNLLRAKFHEWGAYVRNHRNGDTKDATEHLERD